MANLVADCPRCGAAQMTFDVGTSILVDRRHNWQTWFEVFTICRRCHTSTVFVLALRDIKHKDSFTKGGFDGYNGSLNDFFRVDDFVSLKNLATEKPPEHVPEDIAAVFSEGATCLAVNCWNAAGTMFRMCIDMATRALLPPVPAEGDAADPTVPQPNSKQRRDLGLRLPWLFDNGFLAQDLRDLSACIHQDGNDGAHAGTLTKADAEDLLDFTRALLGRLHTEPKRLELAKQRREERRGG